LPVGEFKIFFRERENGKVKELNRRLETRRRYMLFNPFLFISIQPGLAWLDGSSWI
jgi:hypothetical protein